MALTTALSMLHYVAGSEDRNFVDRLHATFTTNLLIGLSVLVSFKQFGGKPLECLVPDLFSGAWEQYAEQYCFASDTYYIPMSSTVADVHESAKRERRISYYQWVPFFLLISAACFRLPSLLWKHFADYSGIRIQQIIKLASDANNIKPDIKAANIRALCVHLQGALRFHRRLQRRNIRPHRVMRMFNIQYSAYYVCIMYLFTKFLFLLNVALQLWLMNSFLGTDKYRFYGFGAVRDLLNGTSWEQSGVFPRVSLCDFTVRVMGNIQDYTIQCVLVINIFNEKIFIFLYLWYLFLLMFTLGSFCYWWVVAFCPCYNVGYIARHLEMSEDPVSVDDYEVRKNIRQFVRNYLKADGMFAIRMLSTYSGVIFGTDLVKALWASYHGIEIARKCKSETDLTKVGVENGKKPGYESYYQRGGGYGRSKDYGEVRRLVPPPNVSPPHDLVKALMDKGSDTSTTPNTSPSKSVTSNPGVNFTLGEGRLNNFYGGQAPPYPGTPTRGTLERRISPPPLRTPNSDSLQRQVFEGRPTSGHGHYSPPVVATPTPESTPESESMLPKDERKNAAGVDSMFNSD